MNKIIQIAKDVYKCLGSGHSEVVYDKAMRVGLRLAKLKYEDQKVVELKYKHHFVGEGYADIIVNTKNNKVVVELKAIGGNIGPAEDSQIKTYMRVLKINKGLIINFQAPKKDGKSKMEFREIKL